MSKSLSNDHDDHPEHLEQIRDIIFGQQKRELESRLRETQKEVLEAKAELLGVIESLKKSLTQEFQSTTKDLESRIFNELNARTQSAANQMGSLDSAMKAEHARLQQEIAQLRDQMYNDLENRLKELGDSRVARDVMADLLIELGKNVKSGKRSGELKLVSQKS